MEEQDTDLILAEDIASFTHDPYGHAMYCYPWGEEGTFLEGKDGPREWQKEILETIGEHLSNPETRDIPCRISVASGHGIGKSALIGMICKWGMDTCVDTRIVCTSNTDTQLRTKTVPEVTKWFNASINSDWFVTTATSIYSNEITKKEGKTVRRDKSWRCDFVPWSEHNTEAFAGLHNEGKRIIVIYDEASGIHDKVWEVTEGALTDENTEIIWIAFGNPTRNIGEFRECFRKNKKYWYTRQIDSREVEGTNVEHFNQLAEKWGEDSDRFKVRVRGIFPDLSIRQLFDTKLVQEAYGKHLRKEQYEFAPKVIAVDPAWEGDDDLVIGIRQGLKFDILFKLEKNTNDITVANKIAHLEDELEADAVHIDGGYGTGIVSAGRTMGRNWRIVWFNEKSPREDCVNMRSAMYMNVADLLRDGLAIPKDEDLYDEMVTCETVTTLDGKIKLPPKDQVKEDLGRSPNCIDCLAISTAYPVSKKKKNKVQSRSVNYNPVSRVERPKERVDKSKQSPRNRFL